MVVGSICNCILPEALKISAVRHDHDSLRERLSNDYQPFDSNRSLRSAFTCISSISMRQKQLSTSSLFLQSPLRGCLPTWELRRSNNGSLRERWDVCLKSFHQHSWRLVTKNGNAAITCILLVWQVFLIEGHLCQPLLLETIKMATDQRRISMDQWRCYLWNVHCAQLIINFSCPASFTPWETVH